MEERGLLTFSPSNLATFFIAICMASKPNVFHNDYYHCLVTHNFLVPDHKHEYNYSTAAVIIAFNVLQLACPTLCSGSYSSFLPS